MRTIIKGGSIVNEGRIFKGSLVVDNDLISEVIVGEYTPSGDYDNTVDATGCFVLPGVIDEHVHFREPGLTQKADIESESRAAAWGGVTTYFDMPNTKPQTTTLEALKDKFDSAAKESHVNYSFFFGATNDNYLLFKLLDPTTIPGIKLFMGASTGNMLVDRKDALMRIFAECARLDLPLMTHCEDTNIINANAAEVRARYGDDASINYHPIIRSTDACFKSSKLAVQLARRFGTTLHVAHISTSRELQLFNTNTNVFQLCNMPKITGEAVIAHLLFDNSDYEKKGALIKCNPSIKTVRDRDALRHALTDGHISCVATDHAPHELEAKQGGCLKAASGMPMIQFSLVSMLGLVDDGVLSIDQLVWLMCHNPARLFSVSKRGFLRRGYKADIVVVRNNSHWHLTQDMIQSKCGWSPLLGQNFNWRVVCTMCNGHIVFDKGKFDDNYYGEAVRFRE